MNWVKDPERPVVSRTLDGVQVLAIGASLRAGLDEPARKIPANRAIAFQGMLPGANYIVVTRVAKRLRQGMDPPYAEVVRPYLTGDDIADDPEQRPSRFVVDFGTRTLEEAMRFPDAVQIVRNGNRQTNSLLLVQYRRCRKQLDQRLRAS